MKKCECGKEIEDKWDKCYACANKDKTESASERQRSIERQVAAKCAAAVLQGTVSDEANVRKIFDVFLSLIRG